MPRSLWIALLIAVSLAWLGASSSIESESADFTFINGPEIGTLDPGLGTLIYEGRLYFGLFEGLTSYSEDDLSPVPGVAERWEVSDDGRLYRFHLRECQWSNGDPVTAGDFEWSWLRVITPSTAAEYASLFYCIENARAFNRGELTDPAQVGIRAVDDRTLEVRLANPTPYFLELTGFWTFMPVHRPTLEKHGERWARPGVIVGNGPFVLDDWKFYHKIRLRKNLLYWDKDNVALNIVDSLAVDNVNTAFLMYETGTADYLTSIPRLVLPALEGRSDYHRSPKLGNYFFRINVTRPPVDDPRVRRALALTIDKQRIVELATGGGETPAASYVPHGVAHYQNIDGMKRNVETARRLLAEAGYPNGQGFPHCELLYDDFEYNRRIAEISQQSWREALNINIELVKKERSGLAANMRSLDYWIVRSNWLGDYNDPTTFLDMYTSESGTNRTGWANPKYDRLIEQAHAAADLTQRSQLLQQAERLLVLDEAPIIPLFQMANTNLYRPHIQGISENLRNIHPLKHISIGPKSRRSGVPNGVAGVKASWHAVLPDNESFKGTLHVGRNQRSAVPAWSVWARRALRPIAGSASQSSLIRPTRMWRSAPSRFPEWQPGTESVRYTANARLSLFGTAREHVGRNQRSAVPAGSAWPRLALRPIAGSASRSSLIRPTRRWRSAPSRFPEWRTGVAPVPYIANARLSLFGTAREHVGRNQRSAVPAGSAWPRLALRPIAGSASRSSLIRPTRRWRSAPSRFPEWRTGVAPVPYIANARLSLFGTAREWLAKEVQEPAAMSWFLVPSNRHNQQFATQSNDVSNQAGPLHRVTEARP